MASLLRSATTFFGGAQQQTPSSSAQRNRRIKRLCAYLTDILIGFLIASLFIATLTLIVALIVRPRPPKLSVVSAAVSVTNTTACNLSILAYNPNSYRNIWYRKIQVSLMYGSSDEVLSETELAPANQSRHSHTAFTAQLVSNGTNDVVLDEVRHHGVVSFRVRFLATAMFTRGNYRTRTHLIKAYCDDIHIAFSNNNHQIGGTMIQPTKGCKGVWIMKWLLELTVLAKLLSQYKYKLRYNCKIDFANQCSWACVRVGMHV